MSIFATIGGRLGRDAETRNAGSSTVTGFALATDHGFGDRKRTLWVDCSVWGQRGEKLAAHLTKGQYVVVSGDLFTHEHNGKTYLKLDVRGLDFGPKQERREGSGGGYGEGQYGGSQRTERQPPKQSSGYTPPDYGSQGGGDDDDIPFAALLGAGLAAAAMAAAAVGSLLPVVV